MTSVRWEQHWLSLFYIAFNIIWLHTLFFLAVLPLYPVSPISPGYSVVARSQGLKDTISYGRLAGLVALAASLQYQEVCFLQGMKLT